MTTPTPPAAQPCPPMDAMSDEQLADELQTMEVAHVDCIPTLHEAARRLRPATARTARPVAAAGVSEEELRRVKHELSELHAAVHIVCSECGIPSQVKWGEDAYGNEEFRHVSDQHRLDQLHLKFKHFAATPSAQGGEGKGQSAENHLKQVQGELTLAQAAIVRKKERLTKYERVIADLRAQLEAVTKQLLDAKSALSLATTHVDCLQKQAQPTPVAHGGEAAWEAKTPRERLADLVGASEAARIMGRTADREKLGTYGATTNGAEGAR